MKRLLIPLALFVCLAAGQAEAARLPRAVVPELYKLIITPRKEIGTFFGDEVISVRVTEPVREITLNSADLEIDRVYVRDSERKQRAQVELDPGSTTMTLRFRRELVPGAAEIRITYRGPLRDDFRGLYVSRSARDEYLFTQLEPVDARRFYPCFDEPDLKARFELTVVVDVGDVAISNTKMISNLPGPGHGTRRVRFAPTPPMSTYMLALAIGPLDCLSGRKGDVPVRFCAQAGQEWKGRVTFEGTIDLLEFYEDWFGIPYPFDKLDVVALPDMAAGGMENPGAIFLREGWALVDRDADMELKRWSSTILAHEVSHMWVGDLVTLRWWSDIWLNEGLATWLAAKALNSWRPEVGVSQIQTFRRIRTFDEDSLGSRKAVAAPVETDENLFELFDIVANEKPAAMLCMVEQIAGEDAVRRAVRDYLITYSWGNAGTDDFIEHMAAKLGDEVGAVIRDYVSKPGFPVIAVESSCSGENAVLSFSQAPATQAEAWHVPVCYRSLLKDAALECVVVAGERSVEVPGGCDAPILVNPGEPGYYRVLYSSSDLSRIVEATSRLTVTERISLLDNEWWLVNEGQHPVDGYLSLIERGFSNEGDPSVVSMILSRLAFIERQYANPEQRVELRRWMRSFFGAQLALVGVQPVKGEPAEMAMLRRELLWGAGALGRDQEIVELSRRYVRDLLDDPGSVDGTLADTMVYIAARSGDDALYNAYLSRARRARNAHENYRFLMGLTSFTSPDLVRRTIELTMTDVVPPQDATSIVSRLLGNPDSAEAAWQVVRDRWPEITRRLPVTFTSERIVHGAGSFCSRERREEVASFFHDVAAPPKTLDASLARIDRCIASRPMQSAALETWLSGASRMAETDATKP